MSSIKVIILVTPWDTDFMITAGDNVLFCWVWGRICQSYQKERVNNERLKPAPVQLCTGGVILQHSLCWIKALKGHTAETSGIIIVVIMLLKMFLYSVVSVWMKDKGLYVCLGTKECFINLLIFIQLMLLCLFLTIRLSQLQNTKL